MTKGLIMSDITSTVETENAFEAPKANLTEVSSDKPILEMKRFSAWGVFFLSIVTFGIYYIYWLISRGNQINKISKGSQVKMNMLYIYLAFYIGSIILSAVAGEDTTLDLASSLLSLIGAVFYIIGAFSFRRVIEEVASVGSNEPVKLGGILTFFFSSLYFQYKINEAIDNQS